MAKNSKKIISFLFAFTLTLALALPSFAAEAVFSKKYVDSNTWSYITAATKETKTTYADVKITNIFKADGTTSTYKRVKVKATPKGTVKTVIKGNYTPIDIPMAYQAAGKSVSMYAMGNDPSLDCRISGYWSVH